MTLIDLAIAAIPFSYFLFIAAITPGPNNVMLTASGMNFGYKKTIPHMAGIVSGFTVLLLLCAFGVGAAVAAFPPIMIGLKILGATYLVYLAWRIFNGGRVGLKEKTEKAVRPLTFLEATGFQFINPKNIVFALAAVTLLPAEAPLLALGVLLTAICFVVCTFATSAWTLFGAMVAALFRDDKTRRIINAVLALLLLATLPMMIL